MNKLCISKLLQVIEQDLIPAERSGGTPERKPQLATASVSSSGLSSGIGSTGIASSGVGGTPTISHQVHQPQPQTASHYQPAHTSY